MKKPLLLILLYALPFLLHAQTDEMNITEVIHQLFKAMATADSALLRSTFTKEVTMATIFRNKEGKQVFTREYSTNDFAESIAKTSPGMLSEEIWNLKIQRDGEFAQAWCDYAFYYQKTFSHCGVDAFHLINTEAGWKIFHLADTRRKTDCIVPETIQKKYK